jgi:hypothetical protein
MIPPNVAALVGVQIQTLTETSALANVLGAAFEIAAKGGPARGTFFRFVNRLVNSGAGISRTQAASWFQSAKYWSDQSRALGAYPPDQPIDPRLARELPGHGTYAAEFGSYRAEVTITITDPETGKTRTHGVWVSTPYQPTPEEILAEAASTLDNILSGSPLIQGKTDPEEYTITMGITSFGRFGA